MVHLMGFVCLFCVCVFVCVCSFFCCRLPRKLPVGLSNHEDRNLAILTQAGNKQNICWHFPAVNQLKAHSGTGTLCSSLPIYHMHARCRLTNAAFPTIRMSSQHVMFPAFSRGIIRGRKVSLMCKFTINNSSLVSPKRPS